MTWRTVVVTGHAHLSLKNKFLVVRKESVSQIHLSEIHTLMIDSTTVTMSTALMNELVKSKVKLIVCDELHNPAMEVTPFYGAFNTSKMVLEQFAWDQDVCGELWKSVVKFKIHYQAEVLKDCRHFEEYEKLVSYENDVVSHDLTNREGHAAKVYFNALFGSDFSRKDEIKLNAFLNYGYTILLSTFNKEIVKCGYVTQIGIHHIGQTNPFNLSCDLIEPFRPIVDDLALQYDQIEFGMKERLQLVGLLDTKIRYQGKEQYLSNVISIYVSKVLANLTAGIVDESLLVYERITN